MRQTVVRTFYDEYERKTNIRVEKLARLEIAVYFLLLLLKYVQLTSLAASFTRLCLYLAGGAVSCACLWLLNRKAPYSRLIKYVAVLVLELQVCAQDSVFAIFINYVFALAVSAFYANRVFCIQVGAACFVIEAARWGALFVRSHPDAYAMRAQIFFLVILVVEYLLCTTVACHLAMVLRETLEKQNEQGKKINTMQTRLIEGIANLVESKDSITNERVRRTATYVKLICYKLLELGYYKDELTEDTIERMVRAAPLHDIGKMDVPDEILCKPAKLTPEEMNVIHMHPLYGQRIINKNFSGIESEEYIETAVMMALCHHEWWNGEGYPLRLVHTEIPLSARIMAAADVLSALLDERPYKRAYSIDETFSILEEASGSQFDPLIIEAVMHLREDIAGLQTVSVVDY